MEKHKNLCQKKDWADLGWWTKRPLPNPVASLPMEGHMQMHSCGAGALQLTPRNLKAAHLNTELFFGYG